MEVNEVKCKEKETNMEILVNMEYGIWPFFFKSHKNVHFHKGTFEFSLIDNIFCRLFPRYFLIVSLEFRKIEKNKYNINNFVERKVLPELISTMRNAFSSIFLRIFKSKKYIQPFCEFWDNFSLTFLWPY